MKRKILLSIIIPLISIVALILFGYIWYIIPVRFLDGVKLDDVSRIEVHDGRTGNDFTIENKEDIEYIVSNIQNTSTKRDGISFGRMGTHLNLEFYDENDRRIDKFIINSDDLIRKDPFFYIDSTSNLCEDYLENIEKLIIEETTDTDSK